MKEAAEKWIPCTATFPDYEICLGPIISIRRVKACQGSFKGKRIAIQHYRKQFWATMYNRFGVAKRVNILDMASWASAAEWKRKGGTAEPRAAECKPERKWIAASQAPPPAPPPKPKPTREVIEGWIRDLYAEDCAAFVKRNKLAVYEAMLADLDRAGEPGLQLEAKDLTHMPSEDSINTALK
jgi:hypothetical protein